MALFCYLLLWSGISVMREERLFRCQDKPKSELKGAPLQMSNMQSVHTVGSHILIGART